MNKFFDYLFYKSYRPLVKNDSDALGRSVAIVDLIKMCLVFDICILLSMAGVNFIELPSLHVKGLIVVFGFAIFFIDIKKYTKKADTIVSQYKNKKISYLNKFLLFIIYLSIFLFPVVIGPLRHNFGINI
jgi:vancomycin permeability regulator SanA